MLSHVAHPDFADTASVTLGVDPEAVALIEAMCGCVHPRSSRLKARLRDCQDAEQLEQLRGEVFSLLALSFGRPEAQRRLQPLQC